MWGGEHRAGPQSGGGKREAALQLGLGGIPVEPSAQRKERNSSSSRLAPTCPAFFAFLPEVGRPRQRREGGPRLPWAEQPPDAFLHPDFGRQPPPKSGKAGEDPLGMPQNIPPRREEEGARGYSRQGRAASWWGSQWGYEGVLFPFPSPLSGALTLPRKCFR